ncbi:MAG TPA: 3-hydroxyacyl-CoA dehydrogenase family protein [Puia sp.]
MLEAAADEDSMEKARKIFGSRIRFVKDVPGMVSPRILSMIISEAYFTLGAGTSSRDEIDTAMKLGTGYPLGPFEWAKKIGIHRVAALLRLLGEEDPLYEPAPLMKLEMEG